MNSWIPFALAAALVALAVAIVVNVRLRPVDRGVPASPRRRRGLGLPSRTPRFAVKGAETIDAPVEVDMRGRIKALAGAVAVFFGALFVRLWGMQLLGSSSYSRQAEENLTREVSIAAPRGRILDRSGSVLVDNRASMALVAASDVADDARVVRRISNLLGMPEVAVRRNIQSTSEGAQSLRTIMIDVPEAAVAYVVEHPAQFPGVEVEARTVRAYPYGTLACHLLGYSGSISQEELDAFSADESNPIDYRQGDTVGKSGAEYQFESVLQGVRGTRTVHVDANGDVTGVVSEVEPEAGSDVRLTIDLTIQQAAEDAIQTGMAMGVHEHYEPTGGACVCMNCKTGEILAMASYPSYDPTSFVGGIGTDVWAQLIAEEANAPLLNRAINGQYPSASTIKPLTACAALEHGVAGYDTSYYCPGWWTGMGDAYGKWCWDHSGHGWMNLHSGIANSCDAVFYEIAKAFYYSDVPEGIQEMYRRWGLGSETGVDLPGESVGRVPDAAWKWDWYTSAADADRMWQPGDTANIAIGQGGLLVTPLQMCYVYCGLVNGGVEMRPHVLLDVLSNENHATLARGAERANQTVAIDGGILSFVDEALWAVVYETSTYAYFDGLPVQVMGKSGTGEAGDDEENTHAWFLAAAPYDDPTYVVCSLVEHGGGGAAVASHMCRQVLGAIYHVPMTDPVAQLAVASAAGNEVMD